MGGSHRFLFFFCDVVAVPAVGFHNVLLALSHPPFHILSYGTCCRRYLFNATTLRIVYSAEAATESTRNTHLQPKTYLFTITLTQN